MTSRHSTVDQGNTRPIALALLGRDDEALGELAAPRNFGIVLHAWHQRVAREPAFDHLRTSPRYQALAKKSADALTRERAKLRQSGASRAS